MPLPESVRLKLAWSEEQFNILKTTLERYFNGETGNFVVESSGHARAVFIPPLPWEVPFMIGDCLQNARSSLDYLVRELSIKEGKTNEKAAFPVCKDAKGFNGEITKRQLAGLSDAMVAAVDRFQPYQAGNDWNRTDIWALQEFCNMNKHRSTPVADPGIAEISDDVFKGRNLSESVAIPPDVKVDDSVAKLIVFKDGIAKGREVSRFTGTLISFVKFRVLPEFETFF